MATREAKLSIKDQLGRDFDNAGMFYRSYFPQEALPTLDTTRPVESQNLLNLRNAFADPNNASFAGAMSDPMRELLSLRKSEVSNTNPDIEDVISRFKGGLDGYTARENQAILDRARREIDSQFAADLRGSKVQAARSGVRGAVTQAQEADLQRDKRDQLRTAVTDLVVKNADEKRSRLKDYADLVYAEDQRKQGRLNDYQGLLTNTENTLYGRGQDAISNYENTLNNIHGVERDTALFNIGQTEKTQSRDIGTMMGILGLLGSRRNQEEQNQIMRDSL